MKEKETNLTDKIIEAGEVNPKDNLIKKHAKELKMVNGFDISKISSKIRDLVLRNCVNSELGFHIFKCAFRNKQEVIL